jgi:hypothetical protein
MKFIEINISGSDLSTKRKMAFNYMNRNTTELRITYPNGIEENFGSITYPGSTSVDIQCKLNELPENVEMLYCNTKTSYDPKNCQLINNPNQSNEEGFHFSLDNCIDKEKIEQEIEEGKKIIYEEDGDNTYRIIEVASRKPIRECWCKFIYDILNTGEAIIKFAPTDKIGGYKYNIYLHGYRITSSSSDIEIKGKISFDTDSIVRKIKRADFIYYDESLSEYIKVRHWEKYSVQSIEIKITISRFPWEFLLETEDLILRTSSLTNCQTNGILSAKSDCRLKDCWCTAYNSLRTIGSFNMTVPMRIVSSSNPYHEQNEYSTTILGTLNLLNKDKMDLTFKFTSKWINNINNTSNNHTSYNHDYQGYY